jgi:tetratricopeptide (TPR) repeat protein
LAREQFGDAASTFYQAALLKPDFGAAHYNRGFALGRAGQPVKAIEAFEESLRHNPERFETYLLLADLQLKVGNPAAAAAALEKAELLNAADPRLAAIRARLRYKP